MNRKASLFAFEENKLLIVYSVTVHCNTEFKYRIITPNIVTHFFWDDNNYPLNKIHFALLNLTLVTI